MKEMELNKIIARTEVEFLGGEPSVHRFWDEKNIKNIDILKCSNAPQKGVQSYATIGLNAINLGLISDNNSLRVEILGACDIKVSLFENIVATIAFEIMDAEKCFPGYILENIINLYFSDLDMKHILLTTPFLWDKAKSINFGEKTVAWLLAVPISEQEYHFALKYGSEELEKVFEREDIDIYNLYRKSVL